jgi:hypothetical protein
VRDLLLVLVVIEGFLKRKYAGRNGEGEDRLVSCMFQERFQFSRVASSIEERGYVPRTER